MSNQRDIKKAQKERLLLREISNLYLKASMDDSRLHGLSINRVRLSPDKSTCWVFFYSPKGESFFKDKLEILTLYKPSLRSAIAKSIKSRYTPNIVFKFDDLYEKQEHIDTLLDELKAKGEL